MKTKTNIYAGGGFDKDGLWWDWEPGDISPIPPGDEAP